MIETFDIVVFDAFGTLFKTSLDFKLLEQSIPGKAEKLISIYRSKLLEYSWSRSLANAYRPFDEISELALRAACEILQIKNEEVSNMMLDLYKEPSAFDDVSGNLKRIKESGCRICILSNGTLQMLQNGVSRCGVEQWVDKLFSVEQIKIYKPHPSVYQMVIDHHHAAPSKILFVSSNSWDIFGAGKFGLKTAWLDRNLDSYFEYADYKPDYILTSIDQIQ